MVFLVNMLTTLLMASKYKAWRGSGSQSSQNQMQILQVSILLPIDIDLLQQLHKNVWPIYGQKIAESAYDIVSCRGIASSIHVRGPQRSMLTFENVNQDIESSLK